MTTRGSFLLELETFSIKTEGMWNIKNQHPILKEFVFQASDYISHIIDRQITDFCQVIQRTIIRSKPKQEGK